MASLRRVSKVESEIQIKLAQILARELSDPRLKGRMVSLSDVELSRDFAVLKCYVFINEPEPVQRLVLAALRSSAPFLRRRLGQVIRLRQTPEVRFYHDTTPERAGRIAHILEDLRPSLGAGGSEPVPETDLPLPGADEGGGEDADDDDDDTD